MEEEVINNTSAAEETAPASGIGGYNDDLHGENLNDRVKALSPGRTVAKRFFRSKLSVIGLVLLLALFLFSFVGPLFSPWGEKTVDTNPDNIEPTVTVTAFHYTDDDGNDTVAYAVSLTYPTVNANGKISWQHWMGTDSHGYDIFTRLMYGGRVSLTIGFVVVLVEMLIGVVLGGISGYFGGWVDNLIMRIVDVLACIPTLPILLILSVIFDDITTISKLYYMMLIMALMSWGGTARLVRGQILSLREQDFMLAAKCSGLSTASKIFRHLLPNVIPQLIVSMTLGLGSTILMEATLGYLNLGAPLGTATWGTMIQSSSDLTYLQYYPNFWLGSGVCITLAVLAFNFVGDGLRDAFDPKMKR
ncbi:MAG: ABC transporter permease [Clostridia bacterium]|nr:ABC transporter permease [Clostridia bacterium]